jgi:hypothetical protein
MDEKNYKIIITETKELKGGIVFDQKMNEEQFLYIINYLREYEENEKKKKFTPTYRQEKQKG